MYDACANYDEWDDTITHVAMEEGGFYQGASPCPTHRARRTLSSTTMVASMALPTVQRQRQ